MVPKAYRIYVGARNTANHTFLPADERLVRQTLARYFKGWTIQSARGIWEGVEELTQVITLVDHTDNHAINSGKTPLESCVAQLKNDLKQAAIMVESGGDVSLL